ncbi:hypothetical protein L7F22_000193 [Adiantum nelumboides]|nr:hypothetical protein [Adiantum nelumboides]
MPAPQPQRVVHHEVRGKGAHSHQCPQHEMRRGKGLHISDQIHQLQAEGVGDNTGGGAGDGGDFPAAQAHKQPHRAQLARQLEGGGNGGSGGAGSHEGEHGKGGMTSDQELLLDPSCLHAYGAGEHAAGVRPYDQLNSSCAGADYGAENQLHGVGVSYS